MALEKPKTLGKINLNELSKTRLKEPMSSHLIFQMTTLKKHKQFLKLIKMFKFKSEENKPIENKIEDEEKETLQTNYQKLSGPKTTGQKINLEEVTEKKKL